LVMTVVDLEQFEAYQQAVSLECSQVAMG